MLYEAHITYNIEHRDIIETDCPKGWKFSAIDGDPVLGKKTFCYLTSYDSSPKVLFSRMWDVVCNMAVDPVRQKIEAIIYDTKTGTNEL